ncbi:hypothetical protein BURC_02234 [Burkholderiaceae bacterium]|nr:hypothetical protein BURC_02234 [Burkholderiaceae bacterium]
MRRRHQVQRWLGAVLLGCTLAAAVASQEAATAPRKRPPPLGMSAAFSPDGALWIVALDEQRRLFVQQSGDEGRSWGQPRVLATGDDAIAADGENRPKLAFGSQGMVIVSYTQPLSKPYTGQVRMLRSADGGRSFSAPFTVHADRQLITHRFESVAFDAKGTLHTLWIDKRDLAAGTSTRGAAIYRNESNDGGRSFGPDLRLAAHSCECCRIALAPSPDGGIVAMWRHVFEPNERDHAFARVAAASVPQADPVRATHDRWAIDACPHHGPGLAPAAGGGYHAVWFGVRDGQARVRVGRLGPDGSPRGEATALPDDRAEHADVASAGAHLAIAWRSFDGQATRWRAWLSRDDGASFVLRELGEAVEDNDHPRLAVDGRRIIALWRTTKGVRVERLFP